MRIEVEDHISHLLRLKDMFQKKGKKQAFKTISTLIERHEKKLEQIKLEELAEQRKQLLLNY